jgi:hypothetical protein
MRALEVFGFKQYLSGPSDHPVDAPDGTSESMLSWNLTQHFHLGSGTGWTVHDSIRIPHLY